MRTLKQADPRVLSLVKELGIKVMSYKEAIDTGIRINPTEYTWGGFYHPEKDFVAFNSYPPVLLDDINAFLLHELVHWTGHSSRLGRKLIVAAEKRDMGMIGDFRERALEEVIAEIGMYKLAMKLGFDKNAYKSKMERYVESYEIFGPDLNVAEKESDIAIAYIIKLSLINEFKETA